MSKLLVVHTQSSTLMQRFINMEQLFFQYVGANKFHELLNEQQLFIFNNLKNSFSASKENVEHVDGLLFKELISQESDPFPHRIVKECLEKIERDSGLIRQLADIIRGHDDLSISFGKQADLKNYFNVFSMMQSQAQVIYATCRQDEIAQNGPASQIDLVYMALDEKARSRTSRENIADTLAALDIINKTARAPIQVSEEDIDHDDSILPSM